jgi:hypothetical protein
MIRPFPRIVLLPVAEGIISIGKDERYADGDMDIDIRRILNTLCWVFPGAKKSIALCKPKYRYRLTKKITVSLDTV